MSADKSKNDEVFIERLEIMDEYILQKHQLEKLIKSGCLDLAKARYVDRRPNYITTLQLPASDTEKDIKALYNVNFVKDDVLESEPLKDNDTIRNIADNVPTKEQESEDINSKDSTSNDGTSSNVHFQLIQHEDVKNNPLKWFGVLVPQSLRNAQANFQKCIDLTVHIANLQLKMQRLESTLK